MDNRQYAIRNKKLSGINGEFFYLNDLRILIRPTPSAFKCGHKKIHDAIKARIAINNAFNPKTIRLRSLLIEPVMRDAPPSSRVIKVINVKNAFRKAQPIMS
jgi:hypothetical protein